MEREEFYEIAERFYKDVSDVYGLLQKPEPPMEIIDAKVLDARKKAIQVLEGKYPYKNLTSVLNALEMAVEVSKE